ncbi:synergin gamma-like isoform X2 [Apostichopus japonicus]|uniref:synergin gamma-like isoform X2 n=1 Tax=Stichopus japonicus TaxID=307972 RepID=UPI003AB430E7
MAYRPPFGYNPGLQQGQQPSPGQMMQAPQQYHPGAGMMQQGYQMQGQGGMVMAPGMYYPNQQQMMMQQGFVPSQQMMVPGHGQPQQAQQMMGPGHGPHQQAQQMMHPLQQQQQNQQPQTEEDKKREEKMKKARYFQEQKMKLQQFGKGAKPGLSLDMTSSLVDSLGGSKRPPAQGIKPSQPKPVETDSFGDFQSVQQQEEEEDDFGDFLQARPTAIQTNHTGPAQDKPHDLGSDPPGVQQTEAPPEAPPPADSFPEKKPEISLEDMMMMSTDLSEATKSAKPIHVKKTLKDVRVQPAATKGSTFAASDKSRTWSSDDNFSSMFMANRPKGARPPAEEGSGEGAVLAEQQQQPQMQVPEWCSNHASLPLVYQQVYQATFQNGAIQTESLYPILLMSGLDRQALGIIWNTVNKTQPGVLERQEMILALGLIALQQNNLPVTLEALFSLKEAPVPNLSAQQAGPPPGGQQHMVVQQPVMSITDNSNLGTEQVSDLTEPVSSFSQSVAQEKETFNSQFDREDHTGEERIHLSEFKSHQPEAQPSNSLEEEFADFQSSRDTQASKDSTPFAKIPDPMAAVPSFNLPFYGPTKSATSPNLHALSQTNTDVDLEFGDFSSHRAAQPATSTKESSFGDFQAPATTSSGGDQWATFQHASSEPSLMSEPTTNGDKYSVFKILEQPSGGDIFVSDVTPSQTLEDSDDDEGGSALRGMVSESDDEEPFSNFQVASIPPEFLNQSDPRGTNIPGSLFASANVIDEESFGDFVGPRDGGNQSGRPDAILFGDSSISMKSGGATLPHSLTFPAPSTKQGLDDFGSFESVPPTSSGGPDKYDAFKDLRLSSDQREEEDDDFGDFHAVEPSSQGSTDTLTLDSEDNFTGGVPELGSTNFVSSLGAPSDNFSLSIGNGSKPPPIHPGLEGPPLLLASEAIIGGDRYSEVAGDKMDDNRHVSAWERCLTSCHSAIKVANDVLNNISSSSVCKQVTSSRSGSNYFQAIVEIYRVACRVFASIKARGVETDILVKLNDEIEKTWTNLSAFLSATPLQIDNGSFVFKTATLRPEPENQERACGVCLLNVDARSKAFDRSEDSLKLNYGGRQYHTTCANLWVNMVDSILPALPLEALL